MRAPDSRSDLMGTGAAGRYSKSQLGVDHQKQRKIGSKIGARKEGPRKIGGEQEAFP